VVTLEGESSLAVEELQLARSTVLLLNNSRPPFDDPLVRQAIQYAVDTQALVDSVYEGVGEPAVGPFAPDSEWAPEGAEPIGQDLDQARSLLDQAGVDPESLSIVLFAYSDRPEFADVAAVLQEQLGELGIDVEIKPGEYTSLEPDLLEGNYDAALLSRGYLVDVADPAGYLVSDWTCDGGYNIARYCDPATDEAIKAAATIEDVEGRNEAYREIAATLQEDAASVWLLHEGAVWGTAADLEGFQPHPLDYYVLTAGLGS
jgi:peptide/nickel transport system substrate-binding protein